MTPKYTVKQIEQAMRASGGFLTGAARKLGCSYQTIRNYINKYSSLQKAYEEINESQLDFSESKLLEQIKEGNTTAIIFHLKCKGKHRGYVERIEQEHTGKDGGPIMIQNQRESIQERLKSNPKLAEKLKDAIHSRE